MGKFVDLTGQQFNQLTVLERDKTKYLVEPGLSLPQFPVR